MPPVEQDALIYGPIRVELLTHKVLAQGKFVRLGQRQKHCNITVKISTESATWLT